MPLISLKDFPGAATYDRGALVRPIREAVGFLAQDAMRTRENKRQEQVRLQERQRQEQYIAGVEEGQQKLRETHLQLIYALNAKNGAKTRIAGMNQQKKELALLAQGSIRSNEDLSVFEDALSIDDPDQLDTYLTQQAMKAASADREITNALLEQGYGIEAEAPEFKTDAGKAIADIQLATDMYGPDSPQVNAIKEAMSAEEGVDLSDVAGMRKEFTKQSGDFIQMRDAYNKLQSASNTGPGDVSLIFSFMKIIDPGSTVREGEFATAEETAGVPTRVRNLYNKAIAGDRLGQEQRDAFKAEATNLFKAQRKGQIQLEQVFKGLAARNKMNPDDVAIDFMGDSRNVKPVNVPEIPKVQKSLSDYTADELDNLSLEELEALQ